MKTHLFHKYCLLVPFDMRICIVLKCARDICLNQMSWLWCDISDFFTTFSFSTILNYRIIFVLYWSVLHTDINWMTELQCEISRFCTVSQKTAQLWKGIVALNYKDRFWWHGCGVTFLIFFTTFSFSTKLNHRIVLYWSALHTDINWMNSCNVKFLDSTLCLKKWPNSV